MYNVTIVFLMAKLNKKQFFLTNTCILLTGMWMYTRRWVLTNQLIYFIKHVTVCFCRKSLTAVWSRNHTASVIFCMILIADCRQATKWVSNTISRIFIQNLMIFITLSKKLNYILVTILIFYVWKRNLDSRTGLKV